jgi:hypothetical protein
MADLSKFRINGVNYDLKDETARQNSGGNVAYDTAQELTDEQKEQARENIGAGIDVIQPWEPYEVKDYGIQSNGRHPIKLKFDINTISAGSLYSISPKYAISGNPSYMIQYNYVCSDGTEFTVMTISTATLGGLFALLLKGVGPGTNLDLKFYSVNNNTIYAVNGDSSTSSGLTKTTYNMLARENDIEYTPTGDYNPATKKYVDDAIPTDEEYAALMALLEEE